MASRQEHYRSVFESMINAGLNPTWADIPPCYQDLKSAIVDAAREARAGCVRDHFRGIDEFKLFADLLALEDSILSRDELLPLLPWETPLVELLVNACYLHEIEDYH